MQPWLIPEKTCTQHSFTGIAKAFLAKVQLFVWQQLCENHSGWSASSICLTLLDAFSPRGKHETFSPLAKVYTSLNIFFPSISLIKKETNQLALQMAQFITSKLLATNFQGPRPDLITNCCWHMLKHREVEMRQFTQQQLPKQVLSGFRPSSLTRALQIQVLHSSPVTLRSLLQSLVPEANTPFGMLGPNYSSCRNSYPVGMQLPHSSKHSERVEFMFLCLTQQSSFVIQVLLQHK